MAVWYDTTKQRWAARLSVRGQRFFAGYHGSREEAEQAVQRLALQHASESPPALAAKPSASDQRLRIQALRVARMQFVGETPEALLEAAETVFQWLKYGDTGQSTLVGCQ